MKLKDFDFRIWSEDKKAYIDNAFLVKAKPNAVVELWSGAYDCNGKKIFEGDIIELYEERDENNNEISICDIVRFNYEDGFYWEFSGKWEIDYLDYDEETRKEEQFFVVGNIHENKNIYDKILEDDEKRIDEYIASEKERNARTIK